MFSAHTAGDKIVFNTIKTPPGISNKHEHVFVVINSLFK